MKKCLTQLSAAVFAGLLVFCMLPTTYASAVNNNETTCQVRDLGNGFTIETTITETEPTAQPYADTKSKTASAVNTIKKNGAEIGTITLKVTFNYDGNRCWVKQTSYSKDLKSGWSYTDHQISVWDGWAELTGNVKKSPYTVPVSISLRCTPHGVIV